MTARRTILSRFRRHPRPVDPEPPRDWIDWLGNGLPTPTRYDAEWPSVLAAEAPGGDLAAMAAPWPVTDLAPHIAALHDVAAGMARDDLGVYAEPDDMGEWTGPVPFVPSTFWARGRHRQTDPLDLILADLRDLGGQ